MHVFWLLGILILHQFLRVLFSIEAKEPKLGLGVNPQCCKLSTI